MLSIYVLHNIILLWQTVNRGYLYPDRRRCLYTISLWIQFYLSFNPFQTTRAPPPYVVDRIGFMVCVTWVEAVGHTMKHSKFKTQQWIWRGWHSIIVNWQNLCFGSGTRALIYDTILENENLYPSIIVHRRSTQSASHHWSILYTCHRPVLLRIGAVCLSLHLSAPCRSDKKNTSWLGCTRF